MAIRDWLKRKITIGNAIIAIRNMNLPVHAFNTAMLLSLKGWDWKYVLGAAGVAAWVVVYFLFIRKNEIKSNVTANEVIMQMAADIKDIKSQMKGP